MRAEILFFEQASRQVAVGRSAAAGRSSVFTEIASALACELDRAQLTLARADHDSKQKTGVNKLGEAERPL